MGTPPQPNREQSVLASLRALVPNRPLAPAETLRIAELQANRLLQHFGIESFTVPEELISELPRIQVVRDHDLVVSGGAYWNGHTWVIALNADEPLVRQRFSLMHEFKHVLDHTTKDLLYHDRPSQSAADQAERVADYFAACLLMPKKVVKHLWCQGNQNTTRLAAMLGVSTRALKFRLDQLGLTEPTSRCSRPAHPSFRRPATVGGRQ